MPRALIGSMQGIVGTRRNQRRADRRITETNLALIIEIDGCARGRYATVCIIRDDRPSMRIITSGP